MGNLRVAHDMDEFQDGESAILTLAGDQRMIDHLGNLVDQSELDVLENVARRDNFKSDLFEKKKRLAKEYEPARGNYDIGRKEGSDAILTKYDEIADAPEGFALKNAAHMAAAESKLNALKDSENLMLGDGSLSSTGRLGVGGGRRAGGGGGMANGGGASELVANVLQPFKVQSDVMNAEEVVKFRKKLDKKGRKKMKKQLDSDDEDMATINFRRKMLAGGAAPDDAGSDEEDPELYEQLRKQRVAAVRQGAERGEVKVGAIGKDGRDDDDGSALFVVGGL